MYNRYKLSQFVETVDFFENDIEKIALFNCRNGKFSVVTKNFWNKINSTLESNLSSYNISKKFVNDFFC